MVPVKLPSGPTGAMTLTVAPTTIAHQTMHRSGLGVILRAPPVPSQWSPGRAIPYPFITRATGYTRYEVRHFGAMWCACVRLSNFCNAVPGTQLQWVSGAGSVDSETGIRLLIKQRKNVWHCHVRHMKGRVLGTAVGRPSSEGNC